MVVSRAFCAVLALVSIAAAAQAQSPAPAPPASLYPRTSVGLALGFGAPYGWGVDLSQMLTPSLDATVGLGLTITGAKVGVGTRYYFSPARKVSAFAGGNLVYSSGLNNVTFYANNSTNSGYSNPNDNTVVNFNSTGLLHLRGGVRWQPIYRFALIGALGYGIVLGGEPVEYVTGPYSQGTRNVINLFAPGGVELSVGVAFGLGSRY